MYKTNQQAWDEVTNGIIKSRKLTKITMELYNQENFIGLTQEQRDNVYSVYSKL
jgi:hypothetical protein